MPASPGALLRCKPAHGPGGRPPRKALLRTGARAAVGLWAVGALLAGAALAGCEYSYDDDGWRSDDDVSPAPRVSEADPEADFWRNDPVSGAELEAWLAELQMGPGLQVVHREYGLLQAAEEHTTTTAAVPTGTYVLVLACRSQRRVTFTVRNDDLTLVDLSLRCGTRRESVVYLPEESELSFEVEGRSPANFAYRLARL